MQRLKSEEVLELSVVGRRTITIDNSKADIGISVGNTDDGSGVLVVDCVAGGGAALAGVMKGDIIFRINEHDVGTHGEAVALIDKAAHGKVCLELSEIQASAETVSSIPSASRSTSSKNLFG